MASVSMAIEQLATVQVQIERRQRIAALILNALFGYSDFTSEKLIIEYTSREFVVPKGTPTAEAETLRRQHKRCKDAVRAADQIQLYMVGKIE
jgi:hypothetical protein